MCEVSTEVVIYTYFMGTRRVHNYTPLGCRLFWDDCQIACENAGTFAREEWACSRYGRLM